MNDTETAETKTEIPSMGFGKGIDSRTELVCTCGWVYRHNRKKVLLAAINKHRIKTGHKWDPEA